MNRMVVLDVLDDLMRLALQAVAHNVLAELRDIILLALLHLHIFFMTLESVIFLEYDASEVTERSLQLPSGRAVDAQLCQKSVPIENGAVECGQHSAITRFTAEARPYSRGVEIYMKLNSCHSVDR